MPSEKSCYRYLNRNRGLLSPLSFVELKKHLHSFGIEHLVGVLWISSQRNKVLRKALMASIGIQLADGSWKKAKAAIDYALDFPDYVRYYERGFILDEINNTLKCLYEQGNKEFVIHFGWPVYI